jgi:hypothetical protein
MEKIENLAKNKQSVNSETTNKSVGNVNLRPTKEALSSVQ